MGQEERDPATKAAIQAGRQAVGEAWYGSESPKTLAYFRLRQGWSQKELAGRMGTSQSYIARLEAGAVDPQVSTLRRLAAVLMVPPSALLNFVSN